MQTVNIGILAHVDAGKTSLTERLLYDSGAIDRLGSVEAGTTQTDTGDIERRRGITIRSAVTAFTVGDRLVNLIDTPGHSDFVAEVERALGVLDGAVLVLSAVEGVQPHTRVLMRILRELRLPTLIFVNKIDRVGARGDELVADIVRLLTPQVAPLGVVGGIGTPAAEFIRYGRRDPAFRAALAAVLAENDDALLADLVQDVTPSPARLWAALRAQTATALAYPLVFGCALSGAGVAALRDGIRRLLPPAPALEQGRYGWPVTDAVVTLTHCGYWSPITVAGDFRDLTPLVLAGALAMAGTRVYEPCHRFDLEIPLDRLGPVTAQLAQLGARIDETTGGATSWRVTGEIPARLVQPFQRQLPGLSGGEGTWSSRPHGDRAVAGPPPRRPRTDGNPFDRAEYLRSLTHHTPAATGPSAATPAGP